MDINLACKWPLKGVFVAAAGITILPNIMRTLQIYLVSEVQLHFSNLARAIDCKL